MDKGLTEKLEQFFDKFPFMKAGSVITSDIVDAENKLGVEFSPSYKDFIREYGGAMVGPYPIYGLRHAEPMDCELWSVVDVTMRYRNEGWPNMDELYVISSDHSDNPIGIKRNGEIMCYDHGETFEVAASFEEYLTQCLT